MIGIYSGAKQADFYQSMFILLKKKKVFGSDQEFRDFPLSPGDQVARIREGAAFEALIKPQKDSAFL